MGLRSGPELHSRWLTVGNRQLHARASEGLHAARLRTPVVLVHGVIVSSRYLMPTAVELAADFPILVPDQPGYGLSEPSLPSPDIGTLADAVIACAVAAGHERVSLVGNSFGGQVVVEAALRHPDRVERIALLGPTVDPAARSVLQQYQRWQRNAPDEHLSCIPVMARDLADVGVRGAARILRVMVDDRIEDKLPRVTCPALVVRGGRDRVVPSAWARRVADLLPRGELVVVPGYAHMAHYSGPLAVAPVLREFLLAGEGQPARSGASSLQPEAESQRMEDAMSEERHDYPTDHGLGGEVAEGMLEEAAQVASGDSNDLDADSLAAERPEPGVIADTGQPAGTADARAARVMDTEDHPR